MSAIKETKFNLKGQRSLYKGKVRDVYDCGDKLVMVTTDRISAFDVVLPEAIPYKGQVLNQIAHQAINNTADIVPNWIEGVPDPNVAVGKKCDPYPVEMVIRGYLAGHAWREYKLGKRELCGESLPEGLKENDKLPEPVITPSTKAHEGHDEDITKAEIISQKLVSKEEYERLEEITHKLFKRGSDLADEQGLILVDTKYEFGKYKGEITLIDEIHTPDSSRYFYRDTYQELQDKDEPQRQLSKEFVRKWLIDNNFQGLEGQEVPEMNEDRVSLISNRYIELFEKITGSEFHKHDSTTRLNEIEEKINNYLA